MAKALLVLAAGACIAAGAAVHGRSTDRWGASAELAGAAGRLADFPAALGDWRGADVPVDAASVEVANVAGHVCKRYVHQYSCKEVTVLLACGRPGSVGAHPPEVCYGASGYAVGRKRPRDLGAAGSAWEAEFAPPGGAGGPLSIVWAWGAGGQWSASAAPRLDFARSGHLYKLYVIRPAATDAAAADEFLSLLLPECRARFAPDAAP